MDSEIASAHQSPHGWRNGSEFLVVFRKFEFVAEYCHAKEI